MKIDPVKGIQLVFSVLGENEIEVCFNSKSRGRYIAQMIYGFIFLILSLTGLVFGGISSGKVLVSNLVFALILGVIGIILLLSAQIMKRSMSATVTIQKDRLICGKSDGRIIRFDELKSVFDMPFVVVFLGIDGKMISINLLYDKFKDLSRLVEIGMTLNTSKPVKSFNKKMEAENIIKRLIRSSESKINPISTSSSKNTGNQGIKDTKF